VVPQAIAYAQIAGLLGYGLFGTCRQLIVSPTSSTAAISAAIVAPVALGDPERYAAASAALAMLVGVVLIALGLLRMGFVSRFISAGVQVGFMFGLGLTIIVGQLPKLLGVPPATAPSSARPPTCWATSATPTAGRPPSGWAAWPSCSA